MTQKNKKNGEKPGKERILVFLTKRKEGASKSFIAQICGINYFVTEQYLDELSKEKKVEKIVFRDRVYWRIKK